MREAEFSFRPRTFCPSFLGRDWSEKKLCFEGNDKRASSFAKVRKKRFFLLKRENCIVASSLIVDIVSIRRAGVTKTVSEAGRWTPFPKNIPILRLRNNLRVKDFFSNSYFVSKLEPPFVVSTFAVVS